MASNNDQAGPSQKKRRRESPPHQDSRHIHQPSLRPPHPHQDLRHIHQPTLRPPHPPPSIIPPHQEVHPRPQQELRLARPRGRPPLQLRQPDQQPLPLIPPPIAGIPVRGLPPRLLLPHYQDPRFSAAHIHQMMNDYKVKLCNDVEPHDYDGCVYTHVGDVIRREWTRHNAEICPRVVANNNGKCIEGNGCGLAHGYYEHYFHPTMYRKLMCPTLYGSNCCNILFCPFAHCVDQLREYSTPPPQRLPESAFHGPPILQLNQSISPSSSVQIQRAGSRNDHGESSNAAARPRR